MVLFIKLAQAIPSDELSAYIHFFDADDDMMSDDFDFKNEDRMHPALISEGFGEGQVPITNTNVFGISKWFMPELKVDNDKLTNPTSTTDQISDHSKSGLTTKNDLPNKMSTPNFESTVLASKREHFKNNNNTPFTNVDKIEDKCYSFTDFFTQMVKFCIESIGLVMDSFMGIIKTNSTVKLTEDSYDDYVKSHDYDKLNDYYNSKTSTIRSKNIKKRDVSEPLSSSSLQTEDTLSDKTTHILPKLENNNLENQQQSTKESVDISVGVEKLEIKVAATLTSTTSSRDLSESTNEVKSEQQQSTPVQKTTSRGSTEKHDTPLSSDITGLGQLIQATETSGQTTKVSKHLGLQINCLDVQYDGNILFSS